MICAKYIVHLQVVSGCQCMLIIGNWLLGSRNLIMPGNYLLAILLEINNYLNCLSRQELSGVVC